MDLSSPATTYVYSQRSALGTEEVCVEGVCGADATLQLLVVLWAGVCALLFLATVAYVPNARDECERERRRTRREATALDRFTRRIASIDAAQPATADVPAGVDTLVQANAEQPQLRELRHAYRETVMAVPHYEDEYDEPLPTNMAAEFDDEVATAVTHGSGLTPQLKRRIIVQATDAKNRRNALHDKLGSEQEALAAADDRLTDIGREVDRIAREPPSERTFGGLEGAWRRLDRLADQCAELLERRQRTVQRRRFGGHSDVDLRSYLYQPLPVDHPVLADGVALADRIETNKRRLYSELASRS